MNIIKLDAIPSTNDFLKEKLSQQFLENFTVVVAENQTSGKGQMGSVWTSETGSNLTFSVLVKDLLLEVNSVFHLNVAVAVSIVQALKEFNIENLSIKWPNDILAGNKKIAGILIENIIKNNGEIFSIVGIGLNVNQIDFTDLPKATSLAVYKKRFFEKELIFEVLLKCLKNNVTLLKNGNTSFFWNQYDAFLYKKGVPMPFEYQSGLRFMGIIQGVNDFGKLEVLLEDDTIKSFDIKEIQMLY